MKGLFDYAAEHPEKEQNPPQEQHGAEDIAETYIQKQERQEKAAQLKEGISLQLEQGMEPQFILYAAVEAIGLLTDDPEWTQEQQEKLNSVYEDLAQRSFIANNEAIAADRREKKQHDYNIKLRTQLQRQLMGYKRIEKGLAEALRAVDELEPQDPEDILNNS